MTILFGGGFFVFPKAAFLVFSTAAAVTGFVS
jgi:hypothetical protein